MELKDYYTILEVAPSASMEEIKKAYRRLAHQHHPDKHADDPYATAQFSVIKEAYETLTNPSKKDQYLQQRWYAQSLGKQTTTEAMTPVVLLKKLLELDKYVHKLDAHRLDKEGLSHYLCELLNDENIQQLNNFAEGSINKEIIVKTLSISQLLTYPLAVNTTDRLKKITLIDESLSQQIAQLLQLTRQSDYWEKRKIWIVLLVVLALCALLFYSSPQ